MRTLARRLEKLESVLGGPDAPPMVTRLIVCDLGRTLNLEKSSCTRILENGGLVEIVNLHGDRTQMSNEEFERFVASFPIEGPSEAGSAHGARIGTRHGSMAEGAKPPAAEARRASGGGG